MILLDTHIWVWWIHGDPRLREHTLDALDRRTDRSTGIHVISCWEVAMLHARKRLTLPCALDVWMEQALSYPGVHTIPLTRIAAVESCRLPGEFHKDPADRILVATAIELGCALVTADERILNYDGINAVHPKDVHQLTE